MGELCQKYHLSRFHVDLTQTKGTQALLELGVQHHGNFMGELIASHVDWDLVPDLSLPCDAIGGIISPLLP